MLCAIGEGNRCVLCGRYHSRPDYPRNCRGPDGESFSSALPPPPPPPPPAPHGPGTELKKLLKKVGITATPNCSCNARARKMDEQGCDWCEANIDEIVGWLREEATKRGLPFLDAAGRMLVRRAIKNARRLDAPATVSPERTADGQQETAQGETAQPG